VELFIMISEDFELTLRQMGWIEKMHTSSMPTIFGKRGEGKTTAILYYAIVRTIEKPKTSVAIITPMTSTYNHRLLYTIRDIIETYNGVRAKPDISVDYMNCLIRFGDGSKLSILGVNQFQIGTRIDAKYVFVDDSDIFNNSQQKRLQEIISSHSNTKFHLISSSHG